MFNYEFYTQESLPIPKVINLITYTVSAYNKQDSTKEEKSLEEPQNPEPNSQWQSHLSSEAWPWTPPCLIINQELLSKGCLVLMIPKCNPADRLFIFLYIYYYLMTRSEFSFWNSAFIKNSFSDSDLLAPECPFSLHPNFIRIKNTTVKGITLFLLFNK